MIAWQIRVFILAGRNSINSILYYPTTRSAHGMAVSAPSCEQYSVFSTDLSVVLAVIVQAPYLPKQVPSYQVGKRGAHVAVEFACGTEFLRERLTFSWGVVVMVMTILHVCGVQ